MYYPGVGLLAPNNTKTEYNITTMNEIKTVFSIAKRGRTILGVFSNRLASRRRDFHTVRSLAHLRIGAHNEDVLATLVGSLLGDTWGESRSGATRFHIHMSARNMEYVHYLFSFFAERGYCSPSKPKITKQIGKSGKIYYSLKVRTFSFSSLNYLHNAFYPNGTVKRVPENITEMLSPRALAVWIMDDGGISGDGVKISTEGFVLEDIERLQSALFDVFNLRYSIQHHKHQYILYLSKAQLSVLSQIVKVYMIPCMYYKLNL